MLKLCLRASDLKSDSGYGDSLGHASLNAPITSGEGNSGMQLLTAYSGATRATNAETTGWTSRYISAYFDSRCCI